VRFQIAHLAGDVVATGCTRGAYSSQGMALAAGDLFLAPRAGFEPATRRLTAVCSTD
jgi:hypothetical protein